MIGWLRWFYDFRGWFPRQRRVFVSTYSVESVKDRLQANSERWELYLGPADFVIRPYTPYIRNSFEFEIRGQLSELSQGTQIYAQAEVNLFCKAFMSIWLGLCCIFTLIPLTLPFLVNFQPIFVVPSSDNVVMVAASISIVWIILFCCASLMQWLGRNLMLFGYRLNLAATWDRMEELMASSQPTAEAKDPNL